MRYAPRFFSDRDKEWIRSARRRNRTWKAIAEKFGCDPETVRKAVDPQYRAQRIQQVKNVQEAMALARSASTAGGTSNHHHRFRAGRSVARTLRTGPPPMKPAPYTPDTLKRIKAGATARDLGWDDAMYASICWRHQLRPSAPLPPPKPAPPLPPAELTHHEKLEQRQNGASHLCGPVYFDRNTGHVERDGVKVELRRTLAMMFAALAAAPDGELVTGPTLCERAGVVTGSAGTNARYLRLALAAINLGLYAKAGRVDSGYAIIDLTSKKRIAIEPVHKKPRGAP